jgi:TRAP transporter 4TM/12TM fusion protein
MSWERIFEYDFMTMAGMFGTIVGTFATYIMPFLIFGSFLEGSGGGDFFINLSKALTGKVAGGPALIAVVASAIFGSISGSPIANVLATGAFTIPMMKKTGYPPAFAGAVEAAASTGGQFLPPIMGAGAFILASLTRTPYGVICIMAVIPALLYYLSVGLMVYFQARKQNLGRLSAEEIPNLLEVLKSGWYYILVLAVAVTVIMLNYSVESVAFYSTIFIIICSFFQKETRVTPKKFAEILASSAKSSLMVGSCAATLGLVMGGITLAGLGVKFSKMLLVVAGGSVFLDIIMILIIALIVGMGLPTTASYIVMAILAAPSLILLGVPEVQAHLLVFWLAMTSNVTPPVCVTAFAAASLADAHPMKTGLHACKLASLLYIMPFTFVYRPALMMIGTGIEIVYSVILYIFACVALSAALQGWFTKNISMLMRLILFVVSLLIMLPGAVSDTIGMVLFVLITVKFLYDNKKGGTPTIAV